jgi:hypothetical protein
LFQKVVSKVTSYSSATYKWRHNVLLCLFFLPISSLFFRCPSVLKFYCCEVNILDHLFSSSIPCA